MLADQKIRLFFDESMAVAIAEQLKRHGIDAITVRDIEQLGVADLELLKLANAEGRVMVTADGDFKKLAQADTEHAGIFFVVHTRREIGYIVRTLERLATYYTADMMKNRFEYL